MAHRPADGGSVSALARSPRSARGARWGVAAAGWRGGWGCVEVRVRWWAAVPLAVVVALAGALADLRLEGALRWVFGAALAVGCLVAVLAVSGPGLVTVMMEPPIVAVLAVAVGTVLTGHAAAGSATLVAVGTRLTAAFPLMAAVTGATVLVGLFRVWRGRPVARAR